MFFNVCGLLVNIKFAYVVFFRLRFLLEFYYCYN